MTAGRSALSNRVLIEQFLQGDPNARDTVVELARPIIEIAARRTLTTCSPPQPELSDIVQDVYVRLFAGDCHALRAFDPDRSTLPTWLSTLTHNITLDLVRKLHAQARLPRQIVASESPTAPSENSTLTDVGPLLLTAREQLVLRLLFEDQLNVDDAASFLNVDAQTVRSTKSRALLKLREHFNAAK